MSARRLLAAITAAALLLLVAVPAALADAPDVSGTVTMPDGSPAAGVQVTIFVPDSDVAWAATTDEQGGWSVATGIQTGQKLSVRVMQMSFASPDESGCVSSTSLVASADITVDAVPVPPIALVLAEGPTGKVCSATATPRVAPTPPATDTGRPASSGGSGLPLLIGSLLGVAVVAIGPARRPKRR